MEAPVLAGKQKRTVVLEGRLAFPLLLKGKGEVEQSIRIET